MRSETRDEKHTAGRSNARIESACQERIAELKQCMQMFGDQCQAHVSTMGRSTEDELTRARSLLQRMHEGRVNQEKRPKVA